MNRLSNRKNAGSRKNKKYKFVNSFDSDYSNAVIYSLSNEFVITYFSGVEHTGKVRLITSIKIGNPQHEKRFADIRDCFPLTKIGHK